MRAMKDIVERVPNEYVSRLSHPSRSLPSQVQEFTDEEMLAIQLLAEEWQERSHHPAVVYDLGAHEFTKAVMSILAKMEQAHEEA